MSRFFQTIALSFSILISVSLLAGCSGRKVDENDPASVYADIEEDIKSEKYLIALDKLRMLKTRFSYSSYGVLAHLRVGDVYFLQESFPEAAAAYETFVELFPKHEKSPYAQFRAGESYFNDIPTKIARDMRSADSAIRAYDIYLKRWPNHEFSNSAQEHRKQAFERLAEKELSIGEFYIRRKKPSAAKIRFEKLIESFPGTPAAEKAKELLKTLSE